ncbi:integrase catalytic domain-containing protein [Trichonephila clavipes]|nr:integrase catalytic domain-containing protein [Trichonephila clavipes]
MNSKRSPRNRQEFFTAGNRPTLPFSTSGQQRNPTQRSRCIKQIALDDKDNPNLTRVLQEDIYMDDLLSGADTPNNAISICKDIAHVLSTRGFHLRKWNSNSTEFLAQFSEHCSHDTRVEFSKDSNESSKVLGLFWNSSNDTFDFQPSLELTPPLTKRRILSESSKIFDPLGLLSPCTVFMKIFYQKLWLTKTDWDSPIPQQLTEDWLKFQKAFNAINYLTVPRWVILTADNTVELHGFSDASSLAYAAAIYYIASLGIDPKGLPDCKLWWQGPPWLRLETSSWPKAESSCDEASDEHLKDYRSVHPILKLLHLPFRKPKPLKKPSFVGFKVSIFRKKYEALRSRFLCHPKSPLRSLHPFIDEHGLVRVGGRLQNSQLRFNSKHPIILPSQHSISELLIKEQHIAHLHARPTLLAHVLRQSHWIVGSRKLINKCIRKCLKCNKFKTSTTTPQLMGNLPKHRVTLERPFFSCDIDYAGPVLIKCNKGRGTKSTKGYIALFVCLAIKAVHIEAVGDLTTDSFIAALRRFSARRGALRHICSDNGINFVGARRKLDEIRKLWLSLPTNEAISYYLSKSSIDWHFIPPSSPHFGVPEELPSTSNHRDRWELLQNIKRGFWKKWSSEFISSLQPRKKWQDAQPNLKEDDIILIEEEGSPGTWLMARVLQVHPGNDGLVRVATVKTQDSVLKRPVYKLHKLPIYPN